MTTSQNNNMRMNVAMPSSILRSVFEHLDSPIFQQNSSKLYWGLHSQLQELHSKLKLIHDVLEEVELMGILFPDLCRDWVSKLLNVLYDVDDLLDEARRRSRPAALPGMVHEKVRPNVSNLYFFHWKLSHKLKSKIIKQLDEIVKVLLDYNLITNEPRQQPTTRTGSSTSTSAAAAGTGGNNVGKQLVARKGIMRYDPETQKSHDIPKIERSRDHKNIQGELLGDNERKILWIVGDPGVGKTTLCRAVYDDKEVVRNFEIRLWVRLDGPDSYIPALKKIARQLEPREQELERIRDYMVKKPEFEVDDLDDEEGRLIMCIRKLINERSLLLVLDNYPPLPEYVPGKDDPENWDSVPDTFLPKLRRLVGADDDTKKGNRIIITKLKGDLFGLGSDTGEVHEVNTLSLEEGMRLFDLTAFGSNKRRDQQAQWQRALGEKIVRNCEGNPALIRCIANFLYGRNDRDTWDKFAKEYRYPSKWYHHRIAALYYTFGQTLHFIGYSILLSKAGLFKYETLVSQVEANGFPEISKRMEKWFRDVVFLKQQSEDLWDEDPSYKLMPFLPLDLLDPPVQQEQSIFRFEAIYEPPPPPPPEPASQPSVQRQPPQQGRPMPNPPPPPSLLPLPPQNSRPQSPSSEHTDHKLKNDVPNLNEYPQHLRSFISLGNDSIIRMPERELDAFVSRLWCVRVLDLSSTGIKVLPHSIGRLSSLRYLDLSRNDFRKLPRSICELKNLQVLKLVYCDKLFELPRCMHKLAPSLKIIRLDMSFHLTGMPWAISRLTGLERLDRFVVTGQKAGLRYLEKLNNLGGRLLLDLPRWWNDAAADAEKAHLERKTGIKELQVKWPGVGQDGTGYASSAHGKKSLDDNDHYDVLKRLKPNAALQELVIVNFGGREFPSWITESQLGKIKISQCIRCQTLPPFHKMPHLKVLTLTSINVEYVGHGCSNHTPFFPSLRELRIGKMPTLKGWYVDWESGPDLPKFPNLEVVEIWSCGNLITLPRFSDVDELKLQDVPKAVIESIDGQNFKNVCIKSIKQLTTLPDQFIRSVKGSLTIEDCRNFTTLQVPSNKKDHHLNLLVYKGSKDLKDLPDGFQLPSSLTSVVGLTIEGFEKLQTLPESIPRLSSLMKLAIVNCEEMKGMSSILKQLKKLIELEISNCSDEVDCFDDTKEEDMPWNSLRRLQKLTIHRFKKLSSLPVSLKKLDFLWDLQIISCPELKRVRRAICKIPFLWHLKISNCEEVDCLNDDQSVENKQLWESICPYSLELEGFKKLEALPEFLAHWRLYKLTVSDCKALKTVPKWKAGDLKLLSVLTIKACPEFSKEIKRLIKNYSFFKGDCDQLSEVTRDNMDVPFYMKARLNIMVKGHKRRAGVSLYLLLYIFIPPCPHTHPECNIFSQVKPEVDFLVLE